MRVYLIVLLLFTVGHAFGQHASSNESEASFKWEAEEINLGVIKQGIPVDATFTFTNEGKAPLVITHVATSCGCTASDYSTKPILAGKTSTITATFDAKHTGVFSKSLTVYSNTGLPVVLKLKGEVVQE
ncbi:MAG: DUF1573 domain-containing protein [Flammeovirgaceae bacterium]